MPRDNQIEESLTIAEELSSLLATKRRRQEVEEHVKPDVAGTAADSKAFSHPDPDRLPAKKKQRKKKTVSFAENQVKTFEVEDQTNSWYHERDYQRIKQENRDTLIAIARAKGKLGDIDANSYCIRGLELQIGITLLNMAPYARQKTVVKGVLGLQEQQRSNHCIDVDALREISRSVSMQDKFKAWRSATIDACRN